MLVFIYLEETKKRGFGDNRKTKDEAQIENTQCTCMYLEAKFISHNDLPNCSIDHDCMFGSKAFDIELAVAWAAAAAAGCNADSAGFNDWWIPVWILGGGA